MLANDSPHLAGMVRRSCPEGAPLVERAFDAAGKLGAFNEIDFARAEGVSYNPRPARIAHIVMRDGGSSSASLVVAAILGCIPDPGVADRLAATLLPDELQGLLELARRPAHELLTSPAELVPEAALLALAHFLDRARHLHQADPQVSGASHQALWTHMLDEAKIYMRLAEKHSVSLYNLIEAWHTRSHAKLEGAVRQPHSHPQIIAR
jgi:hypothetical protein